MTSREGMLRLLDSVYADKQYEPLRKRIRMAMALVGALSGGKSTRTFEQILKDAGYDDGEITAWSEEVVAIWQVLAAEYEITPKP